MKYENIKFDCKHYQGSVPCIPNKTKGKICGDCDEYEATGKKILIIKLGALGDVLRTTPLINKYRSHYPNCSISWITYSPDILDSEFVDKIYPFDFKSVYELKQTKFDIAVNLDKDPEACILLNEVNSNEKHGFLWKDGHVAVSNKAAEQKFITGLFDEISKTNQKSYLQEIFEICGLEFNGEKYLLDVDEKYFKKWKLLKEKSAGKRIIGLNTGCGLRWQTRLWPRVHWEELISMLQKSDFFPVLLGGIDEDESNKEYSLISGAYYPGIFSLKEFISIVANCDFIVTAVSLTMHIALALQKPIVLFNNIFNKYEFELYGLGEILEPDSGCDCYYGTYCKRERHCMYDLSAGQVYESIVRNIR